MTHKREEKYFHENISYFGRQGTFSAENLCAVRYFMNEDAARAFESYYGELMRLNQEFPEGSEQHSSGLTAIRRRYANILSQYEKLKEAIERFEDTMRFAKESLASAIDSLDKNYTLDLNIELNAPHIEYYEEYDLPELVYFTAGKIPVADILSLLSKLGLEHTENHSSEYPFQTILITGIAINIVLDFSTPLEVQAQLMPNEPHKFQMIGGNDKRVFNSHYARNIIDYINAHRSKLMVDTKSKVLGRK